MEIKQREKNDITTKLLVGLLIVASFLIGTLYTKVQFLEKSQGSVQANTQPAAAAAPQAPSDKPTGEVPKITKEDYVRGDSKAPVVLVEYSDLECPYCKTFHPTAKQLIDEYKGKVKWVYRHYPLSFHVNAQKEAEASECAGELGGQDAFWKYIDAIYDRTTSNGTGFALDKLTPLAKEIGLNEAKFKSCLDSGKYTKKVQNQMSAASAIGVNGTPGNIFLHEKSGEAKLIPGALPIDQLKPIVDQLLAL